MSTIKNYLTIILILSFFLINPPFNELTATLADLVEETTFYGYSCPITGYVINEDVSRFNFVFEENFDKMPSNIDLFGEDYTCEIEEKEYSIVCEDLILSTSSVKDFIIIFTDSVFEDVSFEITLPISDSFGIWLEEDDDNNFTINYNCPELPYKLIIEDDEEFEIGSIQKFSHIYGFNFIIIEFKEFQIEENIIIISGAIIAKAIIEEYCNEPIYKIEGDFTIQCQILDSN